jgi:hypothetical protein
LNISLIHVFEVIIFLLVVGKIFQIRKLYHQSKTTSLISRKRNINKQSPKIAVSKVGTRTDLNKANFLNKKLKENYSHHGLPLAEVSFSEGLPLPEVSFSADKKTGNNSQSQSKHKTILNDYIEDFFFESPPQVFQEAEVVEFKHYKVDSNAEEEFITVIDEHEEMIRAFETLEKSAC